MKRHDFARADERLGYALTVAFMVFATPFLALYLFLIGGRAESPLPLAEEE